MKPLHAILPILLLTAVVGCDTPAPIAAQDEPAAAIVYLRPELESGGLLRLHVTPQPDPPLGVLIVPDGQEWVLVQAVGGEVFVGEALLFDGHTLVVVFPKGGKGVGR